MSKAHSDKIPPCIFGACHGLSVLMVHTLGNACTNARWGVEHNALHVRADQLLSAAPACMHACRYPSRNIKLCASFCRPLLTLPAGVFSERYFAFWVGLATTWGWAAGG